MLGERGSPGGLGLRGSPGGLGLRGSPGGLGLRGSPGGLGLRASIASWGALYPRRSVETGEKTNDTSARLTRYSHTRPLRIKCRTEPDMQTCLYLPPGRGSREGE